MVTTTTTTTIVEWYDELTGQWSDLGEAASYSAAITRIASLKAADTEPQRYRIVETRVTEINAS